MKAEKNTTHTPGPWRVEADAMGYEILSSSREMSATVACITARPSETGKADASLIAAAPDLLACLRRMCGMYGAYSKRLAPLLAADDAGTTWTFERANSLALEAIAKAEGGRDE